jgi:hypothetical protein
MKNDFVTSSLQISAGIIPQVSTCLNWKEYIGTIKVRWGFNRDNYQINPGVYAVGTPDENSNVFVTANYKLTFDVLRKNLAGMNAWILVLDTKGINVWCAAGKGTFGTKELVKRIELTSLAKIVKHKRLILPQLGAVGVSAHQVKELSGFNITYGPIRASDIKSFIQSHYKATKEMRRVTFNFYERLKLVPVDFMYRINYLIAALIFVFLLSGISKSGISFQQAIVNGLPLVRNILLGYFSGIVFTPMFLPYLPFRSFSAKGFIMGLIVTSVLLLNQMVGSNLLGIIAWFLLIPSLSSFLAMNFTGSSTYTSLSGVKKEMKYAVPFQITFASTAVLLVFIKIII